MRPRNIVPFDEWAPDTSTISGKSPIIKGCYSFGGKYVPLPAPAQIKIGSQINDDCLGGFTAYGADGEPVTFLADGGRIYRLVGKLPVDVSRGGGYQASLDWVWSFCQFGNNILAIARGERLQRYQLGTSTAFQDVSTAPFGDCVWRIRSQVFIGAGNIVHVSAFNNLTDWTPSLATQSFANELNQQRGLIVAGWGGEQGAIFQERGMTRLNYLGGGVPYQFDDIEGGRGLVGPNAWSEWGRQAFCVAEDGFYVTDGMQAEPIGLNRVDREFSRNLNYSYRHRCWAAIDGARKCWMVGYPTGGSTIPDRVAIYSFADNRWTFDDLDASYGLELHREPVDADDSAGLIELFGTDVVDDPALAEVSVDSAAFRENRKEWGVVTGERKVATFIGPNRPAVISTGTFEPSVGRKTFISELYITTDAPPATVSGKVATRLRRLDEVETESPAAGMNDEGYVPVVAEGRYVRAVAAIAEGAVWTEALGVQTDSGAAGAR